mmetsp:Transcript_6255/g.18354  ORF Transcript_6255/g.18354 Transcript_6255/m.18354 type:complete len:298 (-) Transcript_6255:54-947(-)
MLLVQRDARNHLGEHWRTRYQLSIQDPPDGIRRYHPHLARRHCAPVRRHPQPSLSSARCRRRDRIIRSRVAAHVEPDQVQHRRDVLRQYGRGESGQVEVDESRKRRGRHRRKGQDERKGRHVSREPRRIGQHWSRRLGVALVAALVLGCIAPAKHLGVRRILGDAADHIDDRHGQCRQEAELHPADALDTPQTVRDEIGGGVHDPHPPERIRHEERKRIRQCRSHPSTERRPQSLPSRRAPRDRLVEDGDERGDAQRREARRQRVDAEVDRQACGAGAARAHRGGGRLEGDARTGHV